jgi:hypothetical protein
MNGGKKMSRYYSFNDFMKDVITEADGMTQQRYGRSLEECYKVSPKTLHMVCSLIDNGWWVFTAVVALLAMSMFGFLATLTTFLMTPVGLIVASVLGVAAASKLKQLYHDRVLPQMIERVGRRFKPLWEAADGSRSRIDRLKEEAAREIADEAISWKRKLIGC